MASKAKKPKRIRLRMICDLCRELKAKTPDCQHPSCKYFPITMRVSELPTDLRLEIRPKRK